MQIALSDKLTKYHQQKVKTAVVDIPGRGRIELALSDTQRCAKVEGSARRTLVNLAGEDAFDDEQELEIAATQLRQHCRRLCNLPNE